MKVNIIAVSINKDAKKEKKPGKQLVCFAC